MLLIADSGATKTEWKIETGSSGKTVKTEGLNPYYHTTASVKNILSNKLVPELKPGAVDNIYFYGAGCDSAKKKNLIKKALRACFRRSKIEVFHDLLGAARACCMHEAGIACILGTGSNSCLYDGEKITEHIPSLAFILGDEGSAGYFGKKLINSYFRKELPDKLATELEEQHNMDLDYIMEQLYEEAQFSRFIASYAAFLGEHKDHPFIEDMLCEGFGDFITRIVNKYSNAENLKVSFVGSVACAYQDLIKDILNEHNLRPGNFIQNPMERLVEFHLQ